MNHLAVDRSDFAFHYSVSFFVVLCQFSWYKNRYLSSRLYLFQFFSDTHTPNVLCFSLLSWDKLINKPFSVLVHFVVKKKLEICANAGEFGSLCKSIFKAGLAPFGLALTPNISLVIINLILQGVGNGSQPLMSKYYGEKRTNDLTEAKHMAYTFAIIYLPYYSDKLYDKIRDF